MRYVNPAYSSESQNLIACQYKTNIYFYTTKPILPNQELLVWYCKEFAERLNYPVTGDLMLQRIRQQVQGDEDEEDIEGQDRRPIDNKDNKKAVAKKHPADASLPIDKSYQQPLHCNASLSPGKEDAPSSSGSKPELTSTGQEVNQLTPTTEGSVRSDEGYHSHGYHDDALTPPEDSSDSDNDNYVLDFSRKPSGSSASSTGPPANPPPPPPPPPAQSSKVNSPPPAADTRSGSTNEYRKVKIKMPKAYHYRANSISEDQPPERSISPPAPPPQTAVIKAAPLVAQLGSSLPPLSPRYRRQQQRYSPEPGEYEDRRDSYPSPGSQVPASILESILLRRQAAAAAASAAAEKESGAEILRREYYREVSYRESFKEAVQVIVSNESGSSQHQPQQVKPDSSAAPSIPPHLAVPTLVYPPYKKMHRYNIPSGADTRDLISKDPNHLSPDSSCSTSTSHNNKSGSPPSSHHLQVLSFIKFHLKINFY